MLSGLRATLQDQPYGLIIYFDLWLWRQWRSPRAPAAEIASSVYPLIPVSSKTGCLNYWHIEILAVLSNIVYNHFFFGLPLDRCPCVWPWSSIFGNLSLPMRFTCPKYVNPRTFNKPTMSVSINNSFSMSTFFLLSFLVIPQIFLSTDILNTLNFLLWCSFMVHVSELYRMIDWTSVLYSRTFVGLLISSAFHLMYASHNTSCKSYHSVNVFITWCILSSIPS